MVEHVISEEYLDIVNADFDLVDGLMLRRNAWNKNTLGAWNVKLNEDFMGMEKVVNHYHLYQLFWFHDGEFKTSVEDILEAGRNVKKEWQTRLDVQFPDLNVIVYFDERVYAERCIKEFNVTAFIDR
ncbi:hypothetical protein ACOI22_04275 [Glaciecola sp. 2405UD65-10]|uniref:hypothetical protein n=1 Tax=Glaciecola sp. 2405UD65-10 TaxID=3397244 RepID=UPI003B5AC994